MPNYEVSWVEELYKRGESLRNNNIFYNYWMMSNLFKLLYYFKLNQVDRSNKQCKERGIAMKLKYNKNKETSSSIGSSHIILYEVGHVSISALTF